MFLVWGNRVVDLQFEIEIRGGKRPNRMLHRFPTTDDEGIAGAGKVARVVVVVVAKQE